MVKSKNINEDNKIINKKNKISRKDNKKKYDKKSIIKYVVFFIILLIIGFILAKKLSYNSIYCTSNRKIDECLNNSRIGLIVTLLFFSTGSVFFIKIYSKGCKKIFISLLLFLLISDFAFSYVIINKKNINELVDMNKFDVLKEYYIKKNDIESLEKFYISSIEKLINEKKLSYILINLINDYDELNINKFLINEYKYQIISMYSNDFYLYESISDYFSDLKDYKDSDEKIKEIKYSYAKNNKTNNEINAMNIFKELGDYKDSKEQYNKIYTIHKLDGTWVAHYSSYRYEWIINGEKCYNIFDTDEVDNDYKEYRCSIEDDNLLIYSSFKILESKHEYLFETCHILDNEFIMDQKTFKKTSDSVELPNRKIIPKPSIGMTRSEVRNSTWGEPDHINKDTYVWGTHEQWVYSNNRYIYFDDGIVTSISE